MIRPSRLLMTLALTTTPALAQLGQPCQPGTADTDGLTCAPAVTGGQLEYQVDPGHVLNADKGDVLMTTGCGLIGSLMAQVRPRQFYDHTGIMLEEGYALRHSTAAQKRMMAHGIGFTAAGSDGLDPAVLRYGWPGTISQETRNAFEGEYFTDPDGVPYEISSFNDRADGHCEIKINPAVLKPAPDAELDDPSVRARLVAAADASVGIDGHYRFYGYTEAMPFETAPAKAGWAEGTIPTVCSSFVRHSLKAAGVHLEGALEASDCALVDGFPLAQVQADGACQPGQSAAPEHDGLYTYTLGERTAAVNWLHDAVYSMAYEEAGAGGVFLTDAADDTADQFANCMAFDWCGDAADGARDVDDSSNIDACLAAEPDAKDSNCWENPGIGRAVSPDDMLRWDAPADGGVFGHKQDVAYRGTQYVQVYRWQSAADRGVVQGIVRYNGEPMAHAEITSAAQPQLSGFDGTFTLAGLPPGSQTLEVCQKQGGGLFLSGWAEVDVVAGAVTYADIEADIAESCPVPVTRWTREVTVGGTIVLVDDEDWSDDEIGEFMLDLEPAIIDISEGFDEATWTVSECTGGEVRAELTITARVDPTRDQMVVSTVKVKLYEGTSCDTDDLEVETTFVEDVPPEGTAHYGQSIESDEWNSPDRIDLHLNLQNAPVEGAAYLDLTAG